jgi:hypothetical protein
MLSLARLYSSVEMLSAISRNRLLAHAGVLSPGSWLTSKNNCQSKNPRTTLGWCEGRWVEKGVSWEKSVDYATTASHSVPRIILLFRPAC